MSSYPCPVPLCQHHIQTPFSMEALLISHMNSSEHVFIQDWQRGPPAPTPDDIGLETITIFWKPVPGASHYTLQMKQVGGRGGGGGEGGGDASPGSPTTSPVVAEEGEGEKKEKNKKDKNKDKKDSSTTWITLSSALSGTVVKKKHLEPSTTYLFRYCAHDNQWTGGCTSPFSEPSHLVTTLAREVVRPTPPTLMQRDSTSLTIGWDADVIVGGPPFDLQLRNSSTTVPQPWTHCATVSGRAIKKKSLQPNTKYEFRIRSSSSSTAAWSSPSVVCTTLPSFNPFKQLLGPTLINQQSEMESIDHILQGKKIVMLYFSASWCPPCKQFTPMLATFYQSMKGRRSLEIIFISADRDVGSFQEYFRQEHPWYAIPYEAPSRTQASQYFQVNGIPRLIVFNGSTGEIICSNAVGQALNSTTLDQWENM